MRRHYSNSPQPPNQAMQRTAGRAAFPLSVTSTFNPQPRSPSPAVADLIDELARLVHPFGSRIYVVARQSAPFSLGDFHAYA